MKAFFKNNKGLLFVMPWLVGFLVFGFLPILYSIFMSMTDWGIVGPVEGFIGLDNYADALRSPDMHHSFILTVKYAIFAVPLGMTGAMIAALLLNRDEKGTSTFKVIFYIPIISSGVAIAVMWGWILASGQTGLLNSFLGVFGLGPFGWLTDESFVLPSYIIISVWASISGYLTYLVALKDISKDVYEAAAIEGASPTRRLFSITLPIMKPILMYNFVMAVIASFRKFSEAYILGGAGDQGKFYMVYFYEQAFSYGNMGYAVALAWILVIFVVGMIMLVIKQTPFFDNDLY